MIAQKLNKFISKNREMARRLSIYLPTTIIDPFNDYEATVENIIKQINHPLILDIGGGQRCFLASRGLNKKRVICLDIQMRQLRVNCDVDHRIMGDARSMPLEDYSVDVVISRSFIEHVPSAEAFLQEANRVLKKGGYLISVFPGKFALFAVINQLLPEYLSKKVLHYFVSSGDNELGFKAYYDKCYFTAIKNLLNQNNFKVIDIIDYHFSSAYFEFFLPFFMLSCLYEICTQRFENLASYLLIVAKKKV
jgi:ubiquinone/menaquinone biosynthesis C-methylase UbiE